MATADAKPPSSLRAGAAGGSLALGREPAWGGFVAGCLRPARVWFAAGLSAPLTFLPVQARSPISTCWHQLQHQVGSLGDEPVARVQDSPLLAQS